SSPLIPYTTLFRSVSAINLHHHIASTANIGDGDGMSRTCRDKSIPNIVIDSCCTTYSRCCCTWGCTYRCSCGNRAATHIGVYREWNGADTIIICRRGRRCKFYCAEMKRIESISSIIPDTDIDGGTRGLSGYFDHGHETRTRIIIAQQ